MAPRFLATFVPNDFHRGPIGRTFIRHHDMRITIPPHCFLEEFQRSSLVALLRHIGFQYFPFVIHGAPQIVSLPSDLHEDLVQVPLPLSTLTHPFGSSLPDLVGKVSTETINPVADRFMANVDTAFMKQVFNVTQR